MDTGPPVQKLYQQIARQIAAEGEACALAAAIIRDEQRRLLASRTEI